MPKPFNILLIEDNLSDAEQLKIVFKSVPIINEIIQTEGHCEALNILQENDNVGLVFADYHTSEPHSSYLDLLEYCENNHIPCIVLTGDNNPFHSIEAIQKGAWLYWQKPIEQKDIICIIETIQGLALEIVKREKVKDAM